MTEIQTIDGGQTDALLRRANIKKNKNKIKILLAKGLVSFVRLDKVSLC